MRIRTGFLTFIAALFAIAVPASPAWANLIISQLVIEVAQGSRTADVEILNESDERSFVSIQAREIIGPGTVDERNFVSPNPDELGLLVSPTKVIMEPGQRRRLRIAAIGQASRNERVYRVTVKPVVGDITGNESGLKLLVGYDLLVIVRPVVSRTEIAVLRQGDSVTLTNRGTTSVELVDGKYCRSDGSCDVLPGKRLYAGASWQQSLGAGKGQYRVRADSGWSDLKF